MQCDNVLKKFNSSLLTPTLGSGGGGGVCRQNICYHVAAFVILFNLICSMTMFWTSWMLTLWPKTQGQGVGWVGVCKQNICYHAAVFVIHFSLICNMKVFWKSLILTPPPQSTQGVGHRPSIKNHIFIVPLSACEISIKNIDKWVIAKFKYLTFDTN